MGIIRDKAWSGIGWSQISLFIVEKVLLPHVFAMLFLLLLQAKNFDIFHAANDLHMYYTVILSGQ